ncbi:hypothetical protein [Streptomyces diastaticus]
MIRLPTSQAAITAPLVAGAMAFPGISVGRSLLDGRPFHLSPVLTPAALLPSTNSLALGGLGSGKSSTAKARIRREIIDHGHQAVVIDSFGEEQTGEWAPLVRSLGGRVIEAGHFTLNPCSLQFDAGVREQLVRSLITAVEPGALNPRSTHALQHALTHPKASSLGGLVDALVAPESGRWPIPKLLEWGETVAIALSRYTEGSLRGLFDGRDAALPETDMPIMSFDFTTLDRSSPAIPSLMAAVSCWAEHVWLRQSTAPHRHLVLEEAWQILLSPSTAELIQRLLKNSRKAGLSLDVIMHTLSDLGSGRAQDLARLCEVAHVGRLAPDEAAAVGAILGLPAWAIKEIPKLAPGQAVWKVGPTYVDIIETLLSEEELKITDTSARRRKAQEALAEKLMVAEQEAADLDDADDADDVDLDADDAESAGGWDWAMPPNVQSHHDVLQAARDGRPDEAAALAALYEREAIAAHGINSSSAAAWLETRAHVAELSGDPGRAAQLRATVARMGRRVDMDKTQEQWFEQEPRSGADASPPWYAGDEPPPASQETKGQGEEPRPRRRFWYAGAALAAAALAVASAAVWQQGEADETEAVAAAYTGESRASLRVEGVSTQLVARWSQDRSRVVVELRTYFDPNARYLSIKAGDERATAVREDGYYPKSPEIVLPVDDHLADVTVRIEVGGKRWQEGAPGTIRTVRLSSTGTAVDADTGKRLPTT